MQPLHDLLQQAYYVLSQNYATAMKAYDSTKKEYEKIKAERDALSSKTSFSQDELQRYNQLFAVSRTTQDTLPMRLEAEYKRLKSEKSKAKKNFLQFSDLLNESGLYDTYTRKLQNESQIKQNIVNATSANNKRFFEALIELLKLIPDEIENHFDLGTYLNGITYDPTKNDYQLTVFAALKRNLDVLEILFSIDNIDIHGLNKADINVVGAAFFNLQQDIKDFNDINDASLAVVNFVVKNGIAIGTYLQISDELLQKLADKKLFTNDDVIIGNIRPKGFINNVTNSLKRLSLKPYYPITNKTPGFDLAITTKKDLVNAISSGVISEQTVILFQKAITNLIARLKYLEKLNNDKHIMFREDPAPEDKYLSIEELKDIQCCIVPIEPVKKMARRLAQNGIFADIEIVTGAETEVPHPKKIEPPKIQSFYYSKK